MKLNTRAFSITCSLIWGFGLFFLTWWIMLFDGATYEPTLIGMVYRGFEISPTGSVIGLVWGLADGLIGGFVFAFLYNWFAAKSTDAGTVGA
jgi:hypothetical protein